MIDYDACDRRLRDAYPDLWRGIKMDWWHRKRSHLFSGSVLQEWLTEEGYATHLRGLDALVGHAFSAHPHLPVRSWLKSGFSDPDQFWPKVTELAVLRALDTRGFPVVEFEPKVGAYAPDFRFLLGGNVHGLAEVANLDWTPRDREAVLLSDTLTYVFRELPGPTMVHFDGPPPSRDDDILAVFEAVSGYVARHGAPATQKRITAAGWSLRVGPGPNSGCSSSSLVQGNMLTGEGAQLDAMTHWRVLTEKREQLGRGSECRVVFLGVSLRALEFVPQMMYWAADEQGVAAAGPYKFFRQIDGEGRITIVVVCQVFLPQVGELQTYAFPNEWSSSIQACEEDVVRLLRAFRWARELWTGLPG